MFKFNTSLKELILKYDGSTLVFDNKGKRSPENYLTTLIKKVEFFVKDYKPTTKLIF